MPLPAQPRSLAELLDRAAISDVVRGYAHAVDRRDWRMYRALCTPRIDIDFYTWTGIRQTYDADEWVTLVQSTLACFDATQHTLSDLAVTLGGDEAVCIANMTARHVLVVDGVSEAQMLGGYYTHRLVRQGGEWRIRGCTLMITWEEGERALFARAAARGARARVDVGLAGAL
jgi:hypothetical protein